MGRTRVIGTRVLGKCASPYVWGYVRCDVGVHAGQFLHEV